MARRIGQERPTQLDDIISEAEDRIDAICDKAYTLSASRNARYRNKYTESLNYRDAGYPGTVAAADYPYLSREASQRGVTKRDLADLIIARAEAFDDLGSLAEAARAELQGIGDEPDQQVAADTIVQTVRTAAGL